MSQVENRGNCVRSADGAFADGVAKRCILLHLVIGKVELGEPLWVATTLSG